MIQDVMLFVLQFVNHQNAIHHVKNQKQLFAMLNAKGNIIQKLNLKHNFPILEILFIKRPDCTPMCPDKACEMTDCPKCVNVCKAPHCVTHC